LRTFSGGSAPIVACSAEFPTVLCGRWRLGGRACDEAPWLTTMSPGGLPGRLRLFFFGSEGTRGPFDGLGWAGSWTTPSIAAPVACWQLAEIIMSSPSSLGNLSRSALTKPRLAVPGITAWVESEGKKTSQNLLRTIILLLRVIFLLRRCRASLPFCSMSPTSRVPWNLHGQFLHKYPGSLSHFRPKTRDSDSRESPVKTMQLSETTLQRISRNNIMSRGGSLGDFLPCIQHVGNVL